MAPPKKEKPNGQTGTVQFAFSPLFAHNRPHLSPVEVTKALGISDQQVRNHLDLGRFAAVPIGVTSGAPQFKHVRILRFTVEAWWLEEWLKTHGEEYPLPNSAEITWWRAKLRARGAAAQPSTPLPSTGL